MVSTEASWCNILTMKIYTTLGYIVSLGLVKQYNQELCISSYNLRTNYENMGVCYVRKLVPCFVKVLNKIWCLFI